MTRPLDPDRRVGNGPEPRVPCSETNLEGRTALDVAEPCTRCGDRRQVFLFDWWRCRSCGRRKEST
jgi:hypothetical protein